MGTVAGVSGPVPVQSSSGPGWVTQTCAGLWAFAPGSMAQCPPAAHRLGRAAPQATPALLLQEERSLTKEHVQLRRLLICNQFSSQ